MLHPATDQIMLASPVDDEVLDPLRWFDTPGSLEIEIGCGKGGFLLRRAQAYPELRLLGIEWANRYYKHCADRLARWNIKNVRVMRADAGILFRRHLPPDCVSVIHLYHPDPWPKKRHHKRRLVQEDFARAAARVLVPGGKWLIQTDHEEYFFEMQRVILGCSLYTELPWAEMNIHSDAEKIDTNFETKYLREGRAIYRAAFTRLNVEEAETRRAQQRTEVTVSPKNEVDR